MIRSYKFLFILITILLFFCYCNNEPGPITSEPFIKAAEYYSIKNLNEWKEDLILEQNIEKIFNDSNFFGGFYYYKKEVVDTLCFLAFEYYKSENDTIFMPKKYYKRFISDFFQHIIRFGENGDTLFYYKASLFGELNKIFIQGKYNYQYVFNCLNKNQRQYFRKYKDSLTKVKGHNLPPLLELE